MENNSNSIQQVITQFVLIVFSVVLGLYLSERIEESKKRKESEVLLGRIEAEVKDNISLLREWLPYHQEMHKNLDSLSNDEAFITEFINNKYTFYKTLVTRGTFMGRTPANDAWDIAKANPLITNIEYEKLLILSRVYNQQASTYGVLFEVFAIINAKDFNAETDAKINLEVLADRLHEFVAREKQLMYYFNESEGILDLK